MKDRTDKSKDANSGGTALIADGPFAPVEVLEPANWTVPFIFASPHSGRRYPADLFEKSCLPLARMRASEDAYVDLLIDDIPSLGAPVLKALFPRLVLDVNRSSSELDPLMFSGKLPPGAETRSSRVLAGFGVIPRLGAEGREIYRRRLDLPEAQNRLDLYYRPYHLALRGLIAESQKRFGCAILIDCHSMPSTMPATMIGASLKSHSSKAVDIVLGDRFGHSCANGLTGLAERLFADAGYAVTRNNPYAGGYVAQSYGKPLKGLHVLQIEMSRRLYMDEQRITRHKGFDALRHNLKSIFATLITITPEALQPSLAAE